MTHLEIAIQKFRDYVVSQSKANLTRGDKSDSKELYNSIDGKISINTSNASVDFLMAEYGMYQDKGVSGTIRKYNTPYSYKSKMPPIKGISEWAKRRNIRLREDNGRFAVGDYKTIGFIIARSIKKKGIKPSLFFTKPFEKAYSNLDELLLEALDKDLDKILEDEQN